MTRTFPHPRTLLLAAALVALAVPFFLYNSPLASADHGPTTYWSATLTVADQGGARYGCDNSRSGDECSSALTDDDFTYNSVDYEVTAISLRRGTLSITLDKDVPAEFNDLAFSADGVNLALEDDVSASLQIAQWRSTGLSWSEDDMVELSLVDALSTGVTLSTESLAITEGSAGSGTFTVALSADPGADTTVTLVKTQYNQSDIGQTGHRWNRNAASLSPETLTFTSGRRGDWNTAQTVTVTGEVDADGCPEQLIVLIMVASGADYEPVGDSGNSITGVFITIADPDGAGTCGGI